MLAIARWVTADAPGEAPIDLVCGNVLHMPFNAAFDVAVCFGALGHILPKEQAQFVAQVVKVLKPGGRFVCVTTPMPALWSATIVLVQLARARRYVPETGISCG